MCAFQSMQIDNLHSTFPQISSTSSEPPSILGDCIFQVIQHSILNRPNLHFWQSLATIGVFPEPRCVLDLDSIVDVLSISEPGTQVDYQQICADLEALRGYVTGGPDVQARMSKTYHDLLSAHTNYIKRVSHTGILERYDSMIDRLYNMIPDPQFVEWVFTANVLPSAMYYGNCWPDYTSAKARGMKKLEQARSELQEATDVLVQLKNSTEVKIFFARLRSALVLQTTSMSSQQRSSTVSRRPGRVSQQTQSNHILTTRRAALAHRKDLAEDARYSRNFPLKKHNVNNVHQLGQQGRELLSTSVVQALGIIQAKWQHQLLPEDSIATKDEETKWGGVLVGKGYVNVADQSGTTHM